MTNTLISPILPDIFNTSFVTTRDFKLEKVIINKKSLDKKDISDKDSSALFLYKYSEDNISELRLTIPKNPSSYFKCSKLRETSFTKNVVTGYHLRVDMEMEIKDQSDFVNIINSCFEKYCKEVGDVKIPFTTAQGGAVVYIFPTLMYQKETQRIFTSFYDGEKQLHPSDLPDFKGRIGITMNATDKNFKITLIHCHVENLMPVFPLSVLP